MNSLSHAFSRPRFRDARFKEFILPIIQSVIRSKGTCRILDMGGDPGYWPMDIASSSIEISILNIKAKEDKPDPRFCFVQGDARDVDEFGDQSFDFVHSNSLIEHVGRWDDMKRAAAEIRRLAPRYYVQTPNFWFPFDPHSNAPLLHWMPLSFQRAMVSRKARGFYAKAATLDQAMQIVESTSMLDRAQVAALFPDATVIAERFCFMPKSFIAIKDTVH